MLKTLGYGILGLLFIFIGIPVAFILFVSLMKTNALIGLVLVALFTIMIVGLIIRIIIGAFRTSANVYDKLNR